MHKDVGSLQHIDVIFFLCACPDSSAKTLSVSYRVNMATDSCPVIGAVGAVVSERAMNGTSGINSV